MMKRLSLFSFILIFCSRQAATQPSIILKTFASGFNVPVDIAHAGDDRLFVVEKRGVVKIVQPDGSILPTPFLDIRDRVNAVANERGLLGLAFHPDYINNGYFFVNYTNNSGDTRVARFSRSANFPNLADASSEKIILTVDQPQSNHNGGDLAFGPDNYLYIGLGDGGGAGDTGNFSQTTSTRLGKMLRVDINTDEATPFAIPADNPFVNNSNVLDEIWATGLRNPWRFSFDRANGNLWIADVGQNAREEINFQAANSAGGENYGWRCFEGDASFNSNGCEPAGQYTAPAHVYSHRSGNCGGSITGGFVYRGQNHPDLLGHYLYADYCTGLISSIIPDENGGWINTDLLDWTNFQISSFGEDVEGELYMAAIGQGIIYRITTNISEVDAQRLGLEEVEISPNPFQETLNVSGFSGKKGDFEVCLYDLQGKTVFKQSEIFEASFSKTYALGKLASGVYFLSIRKGEAFSSWKIMKQ